MNKQVTDYIENAPTGHKEILEELRKIIHQNIEGVEEFYKVRRPVFRKGEDFAYIRDSSKYVALGLYDTSYLENYNGLLEGDGEEMRHVKFRKLEDIDHDILNKWFKVIASRL